MGDCTFCEIVKDHQPAHKVYEDRDVLAFLDILPTRAGHLLVVPKRHFATIADLPDGIAAALGRALPRIGRAMCAAVDQPDWTLISNQGYRQVVPHVHYHLIPAPRLGDKPSTGLGIHGREELDEDEGERIAASIRAHLKQQSLNRSKL